MYLRALANLFVDVTLNTKKTFFKVAYSFSLKPHHKGKGVRYGAVSEYSTANPDLYALLQSLW